MVEKKYTTLLWKITTFNVVKLLLEKPHTIFHVRRLAKETELSTTAVLQAIRELREADIVTITKTELTTNVQARLGGEAYKAYKRLVNLYLLQQGRIVPVLQEAFHPKAIVLFGSYAKGEDEEESDVDILVLSHGKLGKEVRKAILTSEKLLGRRVSLHLLPSLEKSSAEFKNSVANGIVLSGYLKVV